jgi:hypothetical protein
MNLNIPQMCVDGQLQINREVLNNVLQQILQSLASKHNASAESG